MEKEQKYNEDLKPIPPSKNAKRINFIIASALIAIAISLGILLTWALQSEDVLNVKQSPIPVRTVRDTPTGDGVVILNLDYCKNANIEGDMRISFVSTTREQFLPIVKERSAPGCSKTESPILIPKDLPADEYQIKIRVTYDVNPLKQKIIEEFKSETININQPSSSVHLP